jgi:hypothetical protein
MVVVLTTQCAVATSRMQPSTVHFQAMTPASISPLPSSQHHHTVSGLVFKTSFAITTHFRVECAANYHISTVHRNARHDPCLGPSTFWTCEFTFRVSLVILRDMELILVRNISDEYY